MNPPPTPELTCNTALTAPRQPASLDRRLLGCLLVLSLAGCASSGISPETRNLNLPQQWNHSVPTITDTRVTPAQNWLQALDSPSLEQLVVEAQGANYQLARQRARVAELQQAVTTQQAQRWPGLALGLEAGRNGLEGDGGGNTTTQSWRADLELSWELDIWGKLSDRERQAELGYQSALATLHQQQIQLAADVASGWFNTIANVQLEGLLQQRLDNVSSDLESLEQGYRRGINAALDVYLSRNTVADSRAALAQQRQNRQAATSALQLLLARYPSGSDLEPQAEFPELEPITSAGTPAQMLLRRPDVQQAWLDLLAADAGLAAAHKDRFPSFTLVGGTGSTSSALHSLVDAGLSSWTIGASLAQALFDAGRLKSLEAQARSRVAQAEQNYLDTVFKALAEAENLLSAETYLRQQLQAQRASRSNADIAYELSLQQYERGLVEYTTVLEAQRRAFDAQTSAIQLHNQVIANRISLYRALGGYLAQGATAST